MASVDLYAVIMAGGSGTRFWPASRRDRPKQFLTIVGTRSMIRTTFDRLEGLVPPERVLVVAGAQHVELVRGELPELPNENLLLEPAGRNTLPCVALAALEIARRSPDSAQVVLPADHVIEPEAAFRESLAHAVRTALEHRALVTLGIRPTHPATGYGYIEVEGDHTSASDLPVRRFVEKPDAACAAEFLASGRFLWNSGIFVWPTAVILTELRRHAAATMKALDDAGADWPGVWAELESMSIDVGVMERASSVRVLPIAYTWSDVGSWSALPDVHPRDADGHCAIGTRVVSVDAGDCIVHGPPGSTTALIGVRDLVVVQSDDGAVLVCARDRAQDVRAVIDELRTEAPEEL